MGEILPHVLVHGDFVQDDLAFQLHVGGSHAGVQQHVAEELQRAGGVLGQGLGIVAGAFLGGVGVEAAAEHVHLFRNIPGGSGGCPFKQHMLDKVRYALGGRRLVAGAGLDPHPDGGGQRPFHGEKQEAQAVAPGDFFHMCDVFLSFELDD